MNSSREDKKEIIADSFYRFYLRYGFKKTTVDEIAADCGISKKTIYHFFKKKEDIYSFVVSRNARRHCQEMGKKLESQKSITGKITLLIDMLFAENLKWIEKGNSAFEFINKYEIAIDAFKEAYQQLFREIITRGMAEKEIPEQDIGLLLIFITGILAESVKRFNMNPDSVSGKDVAAAIIKILQ